MAIEIQKRKYSIFSCEKFHICDNNKIIKSTKVARGICLQYTQNFQFILYLSKRKRNLLFVL